MFWVNSRLIPDCSESIIRWLREALHGSMPLQNSAGWARNPWKKNWRRIPLRIYELNVKAGVQVWCFASFCASLKHTEFFHSYEYFWNSSSSSKYHSSRYGFELISFTVQFDEQESTSIKCFASLKHTLKLVFIIKNILLKLVFIIKIPFIALWFWINQFYCAIRWAGIKYFWSELKHFSCL